MKNWKDFAIIFFILFALLIILKQVFLAIEFSQKPETIDKPVIKTHEIPVVELDTTPPDLEDIKNPFVPTGIFRKIAREKIIVGPPRKIEFKFKLSAIIKQGDKPAAMLINERGNSIIVTKGDEVGNVRIAKIGKDYIVVSRNGQTKTINLW